MGGRDTDEESRSLARSHSRWQRELATITTAIADNNPLSALFTITYGDESSESITPAQSGVLLSGHHFDESSVPFPSIPQYDASTYASNLNKPSSQPTQQAQASASAHGLATEAAPTNTTGVASHMAATAFPSSTLPKVNGDVVPTKVANPDGATVLPRKVAPPALDEEADFNAATRDLLDLGSPEKPAKTVHLPPEDVQIERKRERDEAAEDERRQSEQGKASRPTHLSAQTELASSPSSTVGAYSAATPMPLQESPDTSPDSETARGEVLPPEDLQPTPNERRAQEEHDRLLAAQKEIARKEALGGEFTADDQLTWEAREAAARDAEESAARDGAGGSEPDPKSAAEETFAEEVMDDVRATGMAQIVTPAHSQGDEPITRHPTAAPPSPPASTQEDGDNITVVPRSRPPPIDTSRQQPNEATVPPQMVTRVSSGAMNRKTVSDFLGETPTQPAGSPHARLRRDISSPDGVSPMTMQPSRDGVNIPPAASIQQTPPRAPRPPSRQAPSDFHSLLDELAPLKGVAEDPERDYLEPLFRIQAHDSPQNKWTKPLGELVKMANKSMSTDDQFAALHERMDYRILRRIYHLQNANKWSLRQMDKAKEPEQPVTHWDNMMREMKWMRKDFKAERNMKKRICAYLATQCANYVAASKDDREAMKMPASRDKAPRTRPAHEQPSEEQPPELEASGESAPEDDEAPPTPESEPQLPPNIVVAPELTNVVCNLQKAGSLGKALQSMPVVGFSETVAKPDPKVSSTLSKFVEGKVMPTATGPTRKRSRYDYEDDAHLLEDQPENKRLRGERSLEAEEQEVALFNPENKHIRDRLHANNAFRPPSEFAMPSTSFYEFRNGSQWIWEDDQKLRKLAKEYSFNWSLIAEEMTLLSRYRSSAERRTPWECFERWVELETLPAEMRKTLYFKTWFQRLEQSQQAAERRYQAQVAALQAQAQQNGQQAHMPQRRRTIPTRVEKRKNTRYLWLVDAMRKLAKKRENNAYKQAEAQRAAAQRKTQSDTSTQQRGPMLTPQEFSKRRHERDLQLAEVQRQHRQKMIEAQQRQLQMARAAQQQGAPNGAAAQQRPGTANAPQQHPQMQVNGSQSANMNGQLPQQARPPLPMTTRNGHLAVPQVNAQGIPQAQMQASRPMSHHDMQRLAQQNAQRNAQYPSQQQYQMPNGALPSPGAGGMTTSQQLQSNQQLLAQLNAQQQQQQANNASHGQGTSHAGGGQQMSASPSMPPPPTPHSQQQQQPGQLSSGHVPALIMIKNQLRAKHPHLSEDQLNQAATSALREQSQNQAQSTNQTRQNAMNAAAGISQSQPQVHAGNMQAYANNQAAFQNNNQMSNGTGPYMNGGEAGNAQSPRNGPSQSHQSPQAMAAYANQVRQRQMLQMHMPPQQSPIAAHAQLNGSPAMAHASPNTTPASPSMPYSQMQTGQQMGSMGGRPPSRSNTPQMQRLSSTGSVPGVGQMASGMQSPGALAQGSPRNMQASMAR